MDFTATEIKLDALEDEQCELESELSGLNDFSSEEYINIEESLAEIEEEIDELID